MSGWRARLGFRVPAGTPTVEAEMFQLAPAGVSVHFGRMVSKGAKGTLEGLEARITTQIEHIDESVELLSMVRPDVIVLAHTAAGTMDMMLLPKFGGAGTSGRAAKGYQNSLASNSYERCLGAAA